MERYRESGRGERAELSARTGRDVCHPARLCADRRGSHLWRCPRRLGRGADLVSALSAMADRIALQFSAERSLASAVIRWSILFCPIKGCSAAARIIPYPDGWGFRSGCPAMPVFRAFYSRRCRPLCQRRSCSLRASRSASRLIGPLFLPLPSIATGAVKTPGSARNWSPLPLRSEGSGRAPGPFPAEPTRSIPMIFCCSSDPISKRHGFSASPGHHRFRPDHRARRGARWRSA